MPRSQPGDASLERCPAEGFGAPGVELVGSRKYSSCGRALPSSRWEVGVG